MAKIIESRRQFKSKLDAKQDVTRAIPALMGDGNGTIEVTGQPGFVYIRVGDGDLGQAFNNRCPLRDNLAIHVGYDPVTDPDRRIFQVLSVRMADYAGAGSTPVADVAPHHDTHQYGGGDDVYIDWRRLMGLRVGRPSGFQVTVDEGVILRAGAWLEVAAQNLDLSAMQPAGALSCFVLISLDAAGTATATAGADVVGPLDISDCPIPGAGEIALAAVRLYGTQTAIGDTPTAPDIVDLRFPQANTAGEIFLEDLADYARGSIIRGGAVDWEAYALGGISGSVITRDATDVVWSSFALVGTAAQTYTFPATSGILAFGTGTADYCARWTGTNTIGNSSLRDDGAQLGHGQAPATNYGVGITRTQTGVAALNYAGIYVVTSAQPTGATAGTYMACGFDARSNTAQTVNNLRGTSGIVRNLGGGVVNNSWAFMGTFISSGASATGVHMSFMAYAPTMTSGTLINSNGFYAQNQGAAGITNAYGVYVAAQSGASTLNYSIFTNAATNGVRLGSHVNVVGTADTQQLTVTGYSTQAAATALVGFTRNDANTNAISVMLDLKNNSTGTAANGFGSAFDWYLESSTTADQNAARIAVSWVDATHASRKAKLVTSIYDTAIRECFTVEADGAAADFYFSGGAGSGLPYGSCYGNEIAWTQANAAQNTWYLITDADMADGQLNLVTHDGSGKLTVTKAGRYHVIYNASVESSIANQHIQTGIAVGGATGNDGQNHFDIPAANAQMPIGGNAILSLAAAATVEIAVRTTDAGTPDISVDHLNISIVQVGG